MSKNYQENPYLNGNSLKPSDLFITPKGISLSINRMITQIAEFIEEEPQKYYRLVIGTDSQAKKVEARDVIDFVTAIIIYREGRGAKYFWRKQKLNRKPILRDKIYTETLMSLDVAQKIVPEIRDSVSPDRYDLEIHIDVGPIGPTREMIKEVVGMVTGVGFVAKTKPESWGASSVADKHT